MLGPLCLKLFFDRYAMKNIENSTIKIRCRSNSTKIVMIRNEYIGFSMLIRILSTKIEEKNALKMSPYQWRYTEQ